MAEQASARDRLKYEAGTWADRWYGSPEDLTEAGIIQPHMRLGVPGGRKMSATYLEGRLMPMGFSAIDAQAGQAIQIRFAGKRDYCASISIHAEEGWRRLERARSDEEVRRVIKTSAPSARHRGHLRLVWSAP
jgi:hypothetical protein